MTGDSSVLGASREDYSLPMSQEIQRYLGEVMNQTENLIFGNPLGFGFDHHLQLRDIWMEQDLTVVEEGDARRGASPSDRRRLDDPENRMPVRAALTRKMFGKSVVTAQPGYGKTTLCRCVAYLLALEARVNARGWIPVLLPAHTLNHNGVWRQSEELFHLAANVLPGTKLCEQLLEAEVRGDLWFFVDGLDEVDEGLVLDLRSRLTSGILASPNRVTLTCRTADYAAERPRRKLDRLPVLELAGFNEDSLDEYIENWHLHAGSSHRGWIDDRLAATRGLLDAHAELRELAESPLLAAVLCVVGSRPDQQTQPGRARLLKQAIDHLLLRPEMWRHASEPTRHSELLEPEVLLSIAGQLAYVMFSGQAPGTGPGSGSRTISRSQLRAFVTGQIRELGLLESTDPEEEEAATLAYLDRLVGRSAAGLLREITSGQYDFRHRNFQEYLVAKHLTGYVSHRDRLDLALQPRWTEVFLLTASIAKMATRGGVIDQLALVRRLIEGASVTGLTPEEAERYAAGACLGAEMLAELGRDVVSRYAAQAFVAAPPASADPGDLEFTGLWPFAVSTLFDDIVTDPRLGRATRLRALCVVSRLGDPRFQDAQGGRLGDLGSLVAVPGGTGWMGTRSPLDMVAAKQVPSSPPARVQVRAFEIGRRPVTNLEYGDFIADGGYDDPRWWRGDEAALWRAGDEEFIRQLVDLWEQQKTLNFNKEFSEPEFAVYAQRSSPVARRTMARKLPLYWRDSRFNLPTAPVVGVNLWECQAYCAWLQQRWRDEGRLGPDDVVTLPTETQWEWAAGGSWNGRRRDYPAGDWRTGGRCLIRDFGDRSDPVIVHFGAIPVGFFAMGSHDDLPEDMMGNVWEWVTSLPLPWNDPRDREEPGGLRKRGVRGSSWYSREPEATHVSFRLDDPPCNAYWDLGFRVLVGRGTAGA
ncbi:NACHT domain-containing protein [Streptomyces sp. NPDC086549]|uniref:NACHT domain-containing protein n=1 Tax=Streptomyces sp. NPDC086549 TaxID=3365752 RepID=UPI0038115307